eukprot:m.121425 g.121425  ORF g.121425 m.121425 type:complete len:793 (-) comp14396_c0_seq4:969-3347(-)
MSSVKILTVVLGAIALCTLVMVSPEFQAKRNVHQLHRHRRTLFPYRHRRVMNNLIASCDDTGALKLKATKDQVFNDLKVEIKSLLKCWLLVTNQAEVTKITAPSLSSQGILEDAMEAIIEDVLYKGSPLTVAEAKVAAKVTSNSDALQLVQFGSNILTVADSTRKAEKIEVDCKDQQNAVTQFLFNKLTYKQGHFLRLTGKLKIKDCLKIVNLRFLSNLVSLDEFSLEGVDALENLDDLSSVRTIKSKMKLKNNAKLYNGCGLQRVTTRPGDIEVEGSGTDIPKQFWPTWVSSSADFELVKKATALDCSKTTTTSTTKTTITTTTKRTTVTTTTKTTTTRTTTTKTTKTVAIVTNTLTQTTVSETTYSGTTVRKPTTPIETTAKLSTGTETATNSDGNVHQTHSVGVSHGSTGTFPTHTPSQLGTIGTSVTSAVTKTTLPFGSTNSVVITSTSFTQSEFDFTPKPSVSTTISTLPTGSSGSTSTLTSNPIFASDMSTTIPTITMGKSEEIEEKTSETSANIGLIAAVAVISCLLCVALMVLFMRKRKDDDIGFDDEPKVTNMIANPLWEPQSTMRKSNMPDPEYVDVGTPSHMSSTNSTIRREVAANDILYSDSDPIPSKPDDHDMDFYYDTASKEKTQPGENSHNYDMPNQYRNENRYDKPMPSQEGYANIVYSNPGLNSTESTDAGYYSQPCKEQPAKYLANKTQEVYYTEPSSSGHDYYSQPSDSRDASMLPPRISDQDQHQPEYATVQDRQSAFYLAPTPLYDSTGRDLPPDVTYDLGPAEGYETAGV